MKGNTSKRCKRHTFFSCRYVTAQSGNIKLALQELASMSGSSSLRKGKFLPALIAPLQTRAGSGRALQGWAGFCSPSKVIHRQLKHLGTECISSFSNTATQPASLPAPQKDIWYKCLNICFAVTRLLPKHFTCSCSVIFSQSSWWLLSRFVADIEESKHWSVLSLESGQLEDK